jgi:hypothetical protein
MIESKNIEKIDYDNLYAEAETYLKQFEGKTLSIKEHLNITKKCFDFQPTLSIRSTPVVNNKYSVGFCYTFDKNIDPSNRTDNDYKMWYDINLI